MRSLRRGRGGTESVDAEVTCSLLGCQEGPGGRVGGWVVSADVLLHPIMDNRIEQETLYIVQNPLKKSGIPFDVQTL